MQLRCYDLQHKFDNTCMRIIDTFLQLIAPDICTGCGLEGTALCDGCASSMQYPDRCYVCKKPSLASLTCLKCKKHTLLSALYVVSAYSGIAKEVVHKAKYGTSPSTCRRMGLIVRTRLPYFEGDYTIVTHIPTTPSRVRERGFDQSLELAKSLCVPGNLLHVPLLIRKTRSHQVGSTRKERIEHMQDGFEAINPDFFKGKTVLLVDDVLTTGATMESASRVLKKAGAKRVLGAVFARVE